MGALISPYGSDGDDADHPPHRPCDMWKFGDERGKKEDGTRELEHSDSIIIIPTA